jgi:DNA recombination protein RmuC
MKKLASGRGNLLAQAEAFRSLGWRLNARLILNWLNRPRLRTKNIACVKGEQKTNSEDNDVSGGFITRRAPARFFRGG